MKPSAIHFWGGRAGCSTATVTAYCRAWRLAKTHRAPKALQKELRLYMRTFALTAKRLAQGEASELQQAREAAS